jgi:Ca2+-binding RTX toxin-like protein
MPTNGAKTFPIAIASALCLVAVLLVGSPVRATMNVCIYNKAENKLVTQTTSSLPFRLFVTDTGEFKWEDPNSHIVQDCGNSTVNNVDLVDQEDFNSDGTLLIIDLRRRFAPGATPEKEGKSEIEFSLDAGNGINNGLEIWGGKRADYIVFGEGGATVNDDADYDIELVNYQNITVLGKRKSDLLSGDGLASDSGPFATDMTIYGNGGADAILGSDASDLLLGSNGQDVIRGLGDFDVVVGDKGDDFLFGGPGPDELDGRADDDRLRGGGASDDLEGDNGTDNCGGGSGDDTLAECETGPGD